MNELLNKCWEQSWEDQILGSTLYGPLLVQLETLYVSLSLLISKGWENPAPVNISLGSSFLIHEISKLLIQMSISEHMG